MSGSIRSHSVRVRLVVGLLVAVVVAFSVCTGCTGPSARVENPSFALTPSDAQREIREMTRSPQPLERPLVVLSGYGDPGFAGLMLVHKIRGVVRDRRILHVSFMMCWTFDDCRDRVIAAVDRAYPSDDPHWTTEVDVVGMSMGGLAARYAASEPVAGPDGRPHGRHADRRLRVRRMFTICSPHRGARVAAMPTFNSIQLDMRRGSDFLDDLARQWQDATAGGAAPPYELYPYARLGDYTVGEENTAPPGCTPLWLSTPLFQDAHLAAPTDDRILADIARRLRGEPAYAKLPGEPLPSTTPPTANAAAAASTVPNSEWGKSDRSRS